MGDADGDGMQDFALGAPGITQYGFVVIYSGSDASLIQRIDPVGYTIDFGEHLSDVGDLDGDGLADILIGDNDGQTVYGYSIDRGEQLLTVGFPSEDGLAHSDPREGRDLTGEARLERSQLTPPRPPT